MKTNPPWQRPAPELFAAASSVKTLRDLIRLGASAFNAAGLSFGHGSDNALDEATALVLWAVHLPPETASELLDCALTPTEIDGCIALLNRRIESREPAAYLTGEAWLRGLSFRADKRALVPRSLIVEALQDALPEWLEAMQWPLFNEGTRVLDLCCGSGSIAIHAALMFEQASVTAIDIDAQALELCLENIAAYGLEPRVSVMRSNLLDSCDTPDQFDLILTNPPYVPAHSMRTLPAEYQAEPEGALAAGFDGMDIIRPILASAEQRLAPHGLLILELGHEISAFVSAFPRLAFGTLPVTAGDEMILVITQAQLQAAGLTPTDTHPA
ncbi:MAG: 50S ribosomal protein L3 N(5)-glutamine methyltransferase [Burkholderiaceae bacterium]